MSCSGHPRSLHYYHKPMLTWLSPLPPPPPLFPHYHQTRCGASYPAHTHCYQRPVMVLTQSGFTPLPSDHQTNDVLLSAHHLPGENHSVVLRHAPSKGGYPPFLTVLTTSWKRQVFQLPANAVMFFPLSCITSHSYLIYSRWNITK